MATILVVIVVTVLEVRRYKIVNNLFQRTSIVATFNKPIGTGAGDGMVEGDIARDFFVVGLWSSHSLANVFNAGDSFAIGESVIHRKRIVVVMEGTRVPHFADGMVGDIEVPARIAHVIPHRALGPRNCRAHREPVIVELTDWVS